MRPRLASIVDPDVPRLSRLRLRLLFATGVLAGGAGVAAVALSARTRPPPPPPPPPVVWSIPPPPIVIATVVPPPPPPPDPLGCPTISVEDLPVGRRVHADELPGDPPYPGYDPEHEPRLRVVTAAAAPQLAIWRYDDTVWVSDDDGATFHQVFADGEVTDVAMDAGGTLYALAAPAIGIREPRGRGRWRTPSVGTCGHDRCIDRIATLGAQLVWFHDDAIATSTNHGRSWRTVIAESASDVADDADMVTLGDAVYAIDHYTDMCGLDDSPVIRFDGARADFEIIHNSHSTGERVLAPEDPVGTTWTWGERCRELADGGERLGRCPRASSRRHAMLLAATIRPRTGARVLATFGGGLIELCAGGARQVYRAFPYAHLEAVDAAGRAVIVTGRDVLRWSATSGWRRIYRIPEPESADAPFGLE